MKNLKAFEEYYPELGMKFSPKPEYSKWDLFRDLTTGKKSEFEYNGNTFKVLQNGIKFKITDGEYTATSPYVGSMTDIEGMAGCLKEYKKDLIFDKQGNIVDI